MFEMKPRPISPRLLQRRGGIHRQPVFRPQTALYPPPPYLSQRSGVAWIQSPLFAEQVPDQPCSLTERLVVGVGLVGLLCLLTSAFSELTRSQPERACSVCDQRGHDRRTCPYDGPRQRFSSALQKSRRCDCCGQYGYAIKRHHTRGRADTSDGLDMCDACHLRCGHEGDFGNLPIKPRFCRILDRSSFWCG